MNTYAKKSLFCILIIFLGLLLLLDTLGFIDFWESFGKLWPIILVVIGLLIIFKKANYRTSTSKKYHDKDSFSGIPGLAGDIHVSGLTDGIGILDRSLLFGDIAIDLTGSKLKDGDNTVDASVMFGDIKIFIPSDFPVSVDLSCLAGTTTFNQKSSDGISPGIKHTDNNFENSSARLFIKCRAGFGDLKVETIA